MLKNMIFKGKKGLIFAAILILLLSFSACKPAAEYYGAEVFAMDTIMSWSVLTEEDSSVHDDLKAAVKELEQMISATDENSELYRFNRSSGEATEVSAQFADLLSRCLAFCDETEGALNIALYPILCAWGFPGKDYRVPDAAELREFLLFTDYTSVQV